MMIDSLEMTETDRKIILDNCLKCKEDNVVITHGTDTMEETARVLGEASINKTIVLTGAMVLLSSGVRMDCLIWEARLHSLKACRRSVRRDERPIFPLGSRPKK